MSNTITIELCAEDRARLDRLTAALEARVTQRAIAPDPIKQQLAAVMANAEPAPEAPQKPQDESKTEAKENTQPIEEPTAEPEPVAVAEPEAQKPTITLEQIQQKVRQLAAGFGGAKRAAVRDIINTYAQKVSDIPEDKFDEVWDKLTELEQEG